MIGLLGTGATGEVYEAEDAELGERVALKLLRPDLAADEGLLLRFKREIHLARQVTHPNVCRLYDLVLAEPPRGRREGDPAGLVLVSMERLAGSTLSERLERTGPMAPAEALEIVRQTAAGLDAAHRARVVHRDFKSGNVMLVPEEGSLRAVVTDFGLARADLAGEPGGPLSAAEATTLTQMGSILGSPAYMAPEQVRGEVATAASDLYAFGVVLYEMVTGHLPFEGGGAFQTALRRLHEEPKPPTVWRPDLNPRWERAILACLAREPGDRPTSATAVVRSLEGLEVLPNRTRTVASKSGLRRFGGRRVVGLLGVLGVLGALGLGVGGWLALRSEHSAKAASAAPLLAEGLADLARLDAPAARRVLERAEQIDPQNPRIPWALASAHSLLGHEREAREAARRAFELSSDLPDPDRWEIEARYRGLSSDPATEIALYQRLYRKFPGNLEYGLGLANAQVAGEQAEGAAATLITLRRLPPPAREDPRIEVLAAKAASSLGDLDKQLRAANLAAERGRAIGAPLLVARAQFFAATALRMLGRFGPALAAAEASRAGYAAGGNPAGEALAWKEIGALRTTAGDLPGALAAFDRTVDLASQAGWQAGVSYGLNGRGILLRRQGRSAQAVETFEQLLELQHETSDVRGEAASLNNQAAALLELGRLDEAEDVLDRAHRLFLQLGDRSGEATVILGRCGLLDRRDRLAAAGQACGSARKLFTEIGDEGGMIEADLALARLDRRAGRFAAAQAGLEEGARRAKALGDADLQQIAQRELAELARDERRASGPKGASPP